MPTASMYLGLSIRTWLFLFWFLVISANVYVRPLFPVDETRYASVAWEMWNRNDYLVPHLNGEPYSHKPPLLFWLMTISWKLFGVNNWSHRWISPLFALAILYITRRIAELLWAERNHTADLAPLILAGSWLWAIYGTLTMFDMMLAFFVVSGILAIAQQAIEGMTWKRWLWLGAAIGGGILSKGPVVLLHILPLAILAPWWLNVKAAQQWPKWFGGIAFSILLGIAIALCWAVPAALAGGEAYRNAIFLGQTSGRLVKSFAHAHPWWWYLQTAPLLMLPWLLFLPIWPGFKKLTLKDSGLRFCIAWIVPVFVAFSCVSGKRIHYLLPLIPAMALILAKSIDAVADIDGIKASHRLAAGIFAVLGLVLGTLPLLNNHYRWLPVIEGLSPIWGGLLAAIAIAIGAAKAGNARESVFLVCLVSVGALMILPAGVFSIKQRNFDTQETAVKVSELMKANKPVAYYTGKYHGQYHFTGRLLQPISALANPDQLYDWVKKHPDGFILVEYRESNHLQESIFIERYPLKSHKIGFLLSKTILGDPKLRFKIMPS